jgi:RNA polymerase sigma-B factor
MPPTEASTTTVRQTTKQRIAATTDRLLDRADHSNDWERQQLLEKVVLLNAPVARSIATRYRSRGVDTDDLEQVAYLGLVKAAHGYKPAAATEFLAYAVPTIRGELKRYFRDCAWTVRPPRRLQELQGRIAAAEPQLTQELGHLPDSEELAEALDLEPTDVDDAEAARGCFTTLSLDAPGTTDSGTGLVETLGDTDEGFRQVEAIRILAPAVSRLGERDRKILELRFGCGMTQDEIGKQLGVSQMQVSRLLRSILDRLREDLTNSRKQQQEQEETLAKSA